MSTRRKYTPEQEKRIADIHAEIAATSKRCAQLLSEHAKLAKENNARFLELALIGRGQI